MDWRKTELLKDPGENPSLTADWENSESEKEKARFDSWMVPQDLTANASWSQRSISRSLQRAETLLKSTFNPNLKWLFHGRSQEEDSEEGNFVVAPNMVSRSSARLQHLQQALLDVAPQWQRVGGSLVCVKGLQTEGRVVYQPSSFLQGHYQALWKLLEQRSLLLFEHEYIRRVRLTKVFISRVSHLLEEQRNHLHLNQALSSWHTVQDGFGSLSQELRIHLNHWSCLFSKDQSDNHLRRALAKHPRLLGEIKQTLDSLSLQAVVVMEQYVYAVLSATARTDLCSVPREVLEDIVGGIDLYNQAVEEQRAQRGATQRRSAVLQQAQYKTPGFAPPTHRGRHPAAVSVRELTTVLAAHHAETEARHLHHWLSNQMCLFHNIWKCSTCSDRPVNSPLSCTQTRGRPQHIYLDCSPLFSDNQPPALHPPGCCHTCCKTSCCMSDPNLDSTVVEAHPPPSARFVSTGEEASNSAHPSCKPFPPPPPSSPQRRSARVLSRVCRRNRSSAQLLFRVLATCSDLLAPLLSRAAEPDSNEPAGPGQASAPSTELHKDQNVHDGIQQMWTEPETTPRAEAAGSSGLLGDGDPAEPDGAGADGTTVELDAARRAPSVQWSDLGQSPVYDHLLGRYRSVWRALSSDALWLQLQLRVPHAGDPGSVGLQDERGESGILQQIGQAVDTGLVPKDCRTMMEDVRAFLIVLTSRARWDDELCRALGSALKDKCSHPVQDGSVAVSTTMEHFLRLTPPLLSPLDGSHSRASGSSSRRCSWLALQRQTVSLLLATVQLSTVWVVSKAYQFLSSWSLNKFLLITQGDLKVLSELLEVTVHQIKSLVMDSHGEHHSAVQKHSQLQLRQQLEALDSAVCELQTFSSLVLKTFSSDCKRMSGEIFEQTMPSAGHWRLRHRTGFPISPSEYASLAAQTIIGQVLESVALLSDDARVQALSITMTAFMEAWMEHILKQKIKFSVQGALQLKQDFDSIRDMIQSDRYGLSAELHQRLLSLRVFQQVDSAVVCLLQQPQAKPYLQSRAWGPFTRCCPSSSSRGSITNLRCMEGDDPSQADPSAVTTNLPSLDPSATGEPYLAPSADLGAAQQEWLNLRIHSSARRWRLPGLQCLSKSDP